MKKIILTILFLFSFTTLFAQIDRCSTDKMVYEELQLNPDKKLVLDQLELFTNTFIDNFNNGRVVDTTYIIPVVVHVIHNYGDERISANQIESAIQSMCDDFSMSNDDFINSNGEFVHSTANNNDTVSIVVPDEINNTTLVNWLVEEGSSVQKNDTICILNSDNDTHFIIADDPGNLRFCGGIINQIFLSEIEVNAGDEIAKIITTEARGFEDIASNIGIEFRLATKDPDGNCSTGITYNESTLTYIGGENVKDDTY